LIASSIGELIWNGNLKTTNYDKIINILKSPKWGRVNLVSCVSNLKKLFNKKQKMGSDLLVLDSQIRDWVLIPIVVVMFLVAILRHNMTIFLRTDRKMDLKSLKEG
jgi:hypothetical protein